MHKLRTEYWLGKIRISSGLILDLLMSSSEQSGWVLDYVVLHVDESSSTTIHTTSFH
jgi:hypothetical protein